MKIFLPLFLIFVLTSCGQKNQNSLVDTNKTQVDLNNQIVEKQYQSLLKKIWAELNPEQEKLLETIVQKEEGATMQDIQNQQDKAEVLVQKGLVKWHTASERYVAVKLGKDVYKKGQELIQVDPHTTSVQIN